MGIHSVASVCSTKQHKAAQAAESKSGGCVSKEEELGLVRLEWRIVGNNYATMVHENSALLYIKWGEVIITVPTTCASHLGHH
jgi:hypothetical protein